MNLEWLTPISHLYLVLLVALFGAAVGSFLNVCVHRIPRDESVIHPGSHCPHCGRAIRWYHNLPVLSYFLLRGRCRDCGGSIAFRYVLLELLTALLFVMVWIKAQPALDPRLFGLTPIHDLRLVPVYWLFTGGLLLGTFVDFEHMIIPDRVSLGGIAAGLVLSAFIPSLHVAPADLAGLSWRMGLWRGATGAAVGWGLLWCVATLGRLVFRKEAMGFGDVKLMGAIGAFLGWRGVIFTLVASSLLGSIAGIGLMAAGKGRLQSRIPYGPYLSLAALIWIFWGPSLWTAYFRLLSPAGMSVP